MPLSIPAELKKITPYIRRAEELDRDQTSPESRLVAYYLRQYAVHTGIPLATSSPAAKTCLGELLEQLEKEKPAMDNFTRQEAAFLCRKFANRVFDRADEQDRAGTADKNTAKTFYAAASFLQILEQFYPAADSAEQEESSEERSEDRKRVVYAKWKATEILKAIKEGRKPTPGGYGEDDKEEQEDADDDAEKKTDAPPTVETVKEDDDDEEEEEIPIPPIRPIAPPPVSPPSSAPQENREEDEEVDEEGTEVALGPPPPAYPGPGETQPSSPSQPSPPPAYNAARPPVTYELPPVVQPAPLPAPAPPPPKKQSNGGSSSIFGFSVGGGGKKKRGKISKEQMADCAELTRFALAALEDKDGDLAADRLQQALHALGR